MALGLPPKRGREHAINLLEEIGPMRIRPYNQELVKEMLDVGIIQSRVSPCVSLLLVKKKDGRWRFCLDYRAFYKATITDKFFTPIIEELLD